MQYPINKESVDRILSEYNLPDFGKATIREVVEIASRVEQATGEEFIRMEMGVPGLPAAHVGVDAQIKALQEGKASVYPVIDGIPQLKQEASRFVKAFINIDIAPASIVPVVGSMQGTFASFITANQLVEGRNKVLFIDPGFPVQKQQLVVLGLEYYSFDVYEYRGDKLRAKLEEFLSKGDVSAIIYSNPNNPSWVCLTEAELSIIGELATLHDVVVLEDLAYFAMDFRQDLSRPFELPFQPSVARYTDNYALLISASKAFSYAGERVGIVAISDNLFSRSFPGIVKRYGFGTYGSVFVHRVLYAITSGVSHSVQYAMAAMLKAATDGNFNFVHTTREYGRRAERLKAIFLNHGFTIVYDRDLDQAVGHGFYFTIGYPGMTGSKLMKELIYHGVSAISLSTTGSNQEGLRACTSFIKEHQYELLDKRLALFSINNPIL